MLIRPAPGIVKLNFEIWLPSRSKVANVGEADQRSSIRTRLPPVHSAKFPRTKLNGDGIVRLTLTVPASRGAATMLMAHSKTRKSELPIAIEYLLMGGLPLFRRS